MHCVLKSPPPSSRGGATRGQRPNYLHCPARPGPPVLERGCVSCGPEAPSLTPAVTPPLPCRYLIVTYHNPAKHSKKMSMKEQEEALVKLQQAHGVDGEQHGRKPAQ